MGLDFEKHIRDHLPNLCVQLAWLPLEMAIWEQTVEDFSLFLNCFLSLLLKVPASMMSKYYPWKFNLVICLLISFHLLPLHFEVFVKRLRMIIPFCFLLKSTWHSVKEVLSSKLLILQFRESDLTTNYRLLHDHSNIKVVYRCAQRITALTCQVFYSLLRKPILAGDIYWR